MTPAQLFALLEQHTIATGSEHQDDTPPDDDPGLYASRDGLSRLAQMTYGG